ncbi:short-chain dehydrogenase/reductase SDR [Catenulispora acidiphila DSM 44928]|uniref:Short-chain dehydrogenase/reductase SDR n=1 Tax=Catenulispora acidiphila (strain DSM 44928 / JCM 14897 / NBRC 102108 / NRRL B-24433 / ID139908) TaxID=479433 RepID=C7PYB7_CATAD|nr:SDR family NAD(P)-dependent oxidoreductase [Catenulispora acidiphila]ACU75407.1 short-chain dehydrogenase/reductase SDR [Catenulispora acidiphila DSM 44928]
MSAVDVNGKVMIITGASAGIGEATARAAARAGATVVLAARRRARLDALAAEIGGDTLAVQTDMRDPAQVRRLVETAVERFGRVDVLVNNAGQGLHVPIEQITIEDLAAVVELNVYGALVAMQAVIPLMREAGGGCVINVSSGTTRMPAPRGAAGYAATKCALNMLSKAARAELAPDGIVVSTIYPFVTATEFHSTLRAGSGPAGRSGVEPDSAEKVADEILALIRSGEPEAVLIPEGLRA